MRKQCRSCLYAAPGHAHFCPRCGRVIAKYTPAAFGRARNGTGLPLLAAVLVLVAGFSIAAGGWLTWDAARGPGHLAAFIAGVLIAALGFSASAASLVSRLGGGGAHVTGTTPSTGTPRPRD